MKTPITDAVYPPEIIDREFKEQGRTYGWGTLHDMREIARRLELDRANLMKVLDWLDRWLGDKPMTECSKRITDALTAARANFPKS
jgi:hypothetical protein